MIATWQGEMLLRRVRPLTIQGGVVRLRYHDCWPHVERRILWVEQRQKVAWAMVAHGPLGGTMVCPVFMKALVARVGDVHVGVSWRHEVVRA